MLTAARDMVHLRRPDITGWARGHGSRRLPEKRKPLRPISAWILAGPAFPAEDGPAMEILFLFVGLIFVAFGAVLIVAEARTRIGAVELPAELVGFSTGKSAPAALAAGKSTSRTSFYAVARYAGLDAQTRYLESSVGSSAPLGC